MGDEETVVKLPTKDEITSGLSQVTRTTDGTGWAMAKLDLSEKELSGFGDTLDAFVHIRYLNASGNKIVDAKALGKLTNLLALDISSNELVSLPEEQLEYLQVANIANNKLENPGFAGGAPSLLTLNASNNALSSLEGGLQSSTELVTLNISGNSTLSSLEGIGALPKLKTLDASACGLTSLGGLTDVPSLETLNVEGNAELVELGGFADVDTLGNLREINASSTGIAEVGEIQHLKSLPSLRTLKLTESPIASLDNYVVELLIVLPNLKTLDDEEITEEQREEAKNLIAQREEEARAKAEAEEEEGDE